MSAARETAKAAARAAGESATHHVQNWFAIGMAGLGISFAPHEYIGGLFLAVAAATFAMRSSREADTREIWVVILGAFLASHVAAIAAHTWRPEWSPQLVMVAAGFSSRYLTRTALRVLGLVEERSDRIADRLVDRILPDDDERR